MTRTSCWLRVSEKTEPGFVLIVDTGPLVAMGDRDDPDHAACYELLRTTPERLVTTAMVIAEAAYLLNRQVGPKAEVALFNDITDGLVNIEALTRTDWHRISGLVDQYADMELGGTDASLIAIAERLGVTEIATIDHRHFHAVRPTHTPGFVLLP